ncbi:aldose epimerase family protein [Streptomyces sp. NBC_01445]|uniref:aldose epimerase family protein n=1 Tax=Streptomyces sp. NBC_01445 TaxID=2903869 RepID=UPI002DDAF7DD|nr:aldose epimerase family protein [Streptomyces sp. NBC_01445]WSE10967.1 galactose mutarotase [Streptomyces sp. NBC_01445]
MSFAAPFSAPFGATPSGLPVERWTLRSASGVEAAVLTYGAVLHSLRVPGPSGSRPPAEVVLSLPDVKHYATHGAYLGAVVGRYANRIAAGTFTLDGTRHHIPGNDRGNSLHGGADGFDRRVWRAESRERPDGAASVRLSLDSPHGDQGFPGSLQVSVTYTLASDGSLTLDYRGVTDRPTPVNLTNHAYFNLSGNPDRGVLDHLLTVDATTYLPIDETGLPLPGAPAPVAGSPFDFTRSRRIGARIAEPDEQLRRADGYDHCWALDDRERPSGEGQLVLRRAARLEDPGSGRVLEVHTSEPGLQVYAGQQLDGGFGDFLGRRLGAHSGLCLESQHFPDSPNRSEYPSTVLRPDQVMRSRTVLSFPHLTTVAR